MPARSAAAQVDDRELAAQAATLVDAFVYEEPVLTRDRSRVVWAARSTGCGARPPLRRRRGRSIASAELARSRTRERVVADLAAAGLVREDAGGTLHATDELRLLLI